MRRWPGTPELVMAVQIDVLDPRQHSEPPYWEALRIRAGLRADWSYELLRIAAWCSPVPLLLTVLRDSAEAVGLICASWTGVPAHHGKYVAPRGRPWLGALYVESPGTSAVPGWWFAERLSLTERTELCWDYLHGMRRELGPRCRGVVWRHAAAADLPVLRGKRRGLLRSTSSIAVLPLAWPTPEQWLASLSRSRRNDLRRQRRHVDADPDLSVCVGPGGDLDPGQVARLLRANEAKYADRHAGLPITTSMVTALLGRDDVVTVRYIDHAGRLLGFGAVLDHPTAPVSRHWAGVAVEHGGRRHLYFDMYLRVIEWAMQTGRKEINFGRAKLDIKRDLGCELQSRYSVAVPCW